MIEPRPPLALRKERIDADARQQPQLPVVDRPPQIAPSPLLVAFLPFRLVIFFEEVEVADPAHGAAGLPAAEEAVGRATEILAVPPERPAAEGVARIARVDEVAAVEAEVVDAMIDHKPGVGNAVGWRLEPKKFRPVVEQRGAEAGAAEAQVVDIEIPIDARRWPPHTEHLKHVPTRKDLRAEDLVVLHLRVVDVERRLLGIGRQHRPPEHGHATERDRVAAAADELLVGHRRLTRDRIDHRLSKWPRHRHLLVGKLQFPGAKFPGGHAEPARREARSLGHKSTPVDLADHVGPQPHKPRIVVDRREHGGSGDHAARSRHVVKHAHRLDHPLPLAEDDIALHVEFQRRVGRLRRRAIQVGLGLAAGPNHEPVGGDVERAGRIDAIDDEIHARRDHGDPLVTAGGTGKPANIQRHARARKGP